MEMETEMETETETDVKYDKVQVMFTQLGTTVPENWVLLDSQSTVCIFRCNKYVSNIRQSNKRVRLITNGGKQISTLVGDLPNFGTVWYSLNSLLVANILSVADVRKRCRITMDSKKEAAILVHHSEGSVMKFSDLIQAFTIMMQINIVTPQLAIIALPKP